MVACEHHREKTTEISKTLLDSILIPVTDGNSADEETMEELMAELHVSDEESVSAFLPKIKATDSNPFVSGVVYIFLLALVVAIVRASF